MMVNGGVLTEVLMVVLGCMFMAGSIAKGLVVARTSPRMPASGTLRVLLFLIGLIVFIQGMRLLIR